MEKMIINGVEYVKLSDIPATSCEISDDASIATNYIDKFVIVRSRNEGINAGTVVACDKTGVQLKNCRRLWNHKPLDEKMSWYEGVAISGIHADSEISEISAGKMIIENYSMTLCSEVAQKSIMDKDAHSSR